MPVFVALLRAINVGGKNKLPMKPLAEMFAAAGCTAVSTFIQSGNVIYRATPAVGRRVSKVVSAAIADEYGLRVPVLTRTVDELAIALENNPFVAAGVDEDQLHLGFLADAPESARVDAIDAKRFAPDELVVQGREIYFRYAGGAGKTRLTTQFLDSKLGTITTVRNWRTSRRLLELARSA